MSRHPHPAHDGAGKQPLADGAAASMPAFGAVRRVTATETMALHHSFKPAALGDPNGVDEIGFGKNVRSQHIARLHFAREIAKLFDPLDRRRVELLQVS